MANHTSGKVTEKLVEAAKLLGDGLTTEEIGALLNISSWSVKDRLARLRNLVGSSEMRGATIREQVMRWWLVEGRQTMAAPTIERYRAEWEKPLYCENCGEVRHRLVRVEGVKRDEVWECMECGMTKWFRTG